MSFPDNPELLRTPRNFAAHVLAGNLKSKEISHQLTNLLGFAKNFYLQFFDFEYGIQILGMDRSARRKIKPIERELRSSMKDLPRLRLVSHFVTLVEFLEEDLGTSLEDDIVTADRRRRILEDVAVLIERIEAFADASDLEKLCNQAGVVGAEFVRAAETIDFEDEDG